MQVISFDKAIWDFIRIFPNANRDKSIIFQKFPIKMSFFCFVFGDFLFVFFFWEKYDNFIKSSCVEDGVGFWGLLMALVKKSKIKMMSN